MTYLMPKTLPASITIGAKTFSLITPAQSVKRGVCKGNNDGWFYYFAKTVVDDLSNNAIGSRRHFSIRHAKGRRAIHISMKPSPGKQDDIMIWYRYDAQWTGKEQEPEGWGRIDPYPGQNAVRVAKAVSLLKTFLEAMTAVAEGKAPVSPTMPELSPPLCNHLINSGGGWGESNEDLPPPVNYDNSPPSSPKVAIAEQRDVPDNWEDF